MKIFLFPGQGSQTVAMGKTLYDNYKSAAETFEEANDALGFDLKKICFEGPEADLKLTENTQPAILTHSIAAFRVLSEETNLKPNFVAGHSLGEYSALVAAGSLKFSDAVKIVNKRGKFMQEAVPVGTGSMAALLGAVESTANALCNEATKITGKICEVANLNGAGQIVISGHKEAIEETVKIAQANPEYGIKKVILLPVTAPFHCSLMKPAEENLKPFLDAIEIKAPLFTYIANIDAKPYKDAYAIKGNFLKQICGTVRWEQSMESLASLGICEAYEIGPGKVLTGLMKRINANIPSKCVDMQKDILALKG